MATQNINAVILTGNLTRDPDLQSMPSGSKVCKMRIACNGRRKDGASGEWIDKPNFFDVVVFGNSGEACARYLSKGRPLAVSGRLDWSEWERDGQKRQAVQIIADNVQFLGGGDERGASESAPPPVSTRATEDDDIPF